MNNKKIGTAFEKRVCQMLASDGWWVHFIEPKQNGAQPFDIIAVKAGGAIAIDCKTCASKYFGFDRLEDNQVMAFEKWLACGNAMPLVYIEHDGRVFVIRYQYIKEKNRINLEADKNIMEVRNGQEQ